MAKAVWQSSIVNSAGDIIPGALVEFRRSDTLTLVSLYADRDGMSGESNPAAAGLDGFLRVYLDEGTYRITVTAPGYSRVYEHVPIFENTNSGDSSEYLSVAIASGNVDDWTAGGDLDTATGFLDVNPSSGNTVLRGIDASLLRNGQELVITNVHASNTLELAIEDAGSAEVNRFRGYSAGGNVLLLQNMSVTSKKSSGAGRLLVLL
jgi:hypothetical protein